MPVSWAPPNWPHMPVSRPDSTGIGPNYYCCTIGGGRLGCGGRRAFWQGCPRMCCRLVVVSTRNRFAPAGTRTRRRESGGAGCRACAPTFCSVPVCMCIGFCPCVSVCTLQNAGACSRETQSMCACGMYVSVRLFCLSFCLRKNTCVPTWQRMPALFCAILLSNAPYLLSRDSCQAAGYFSNTIQATVCLNCQAGSYSNATQITLCLKAPTVLLQRDSSHSMPHLPGRLLGSYYSNTTQSTLWLLLQHDQSHSMSGVSERLLL